MSQTIFTSESVTEGHPDKVADQISDAVLDAMLMDDPGSRVACETLVTTGMALVAGEITSASQVDVPGLVRETLLKIGYDNADYGIDGATCAVIATLDKQSPHIALGVDTGGAGDQGMMFGYATDETADFMPAPIHYAHALVQRLSEVRHNKTLPWVRPDGKSQVSVAYENGHPRSVETVVISTQHAPDVDNDTIRESIIREVILPVIPSDLLDPDSCTFHINPTGQFVIGGPHGDAGLTGRKIIVDTYGGMGRHGGGAFSGKDATKVDRSAAYAARWAARNLVEAGAASRCEIQLAYAIGVAQPVSIHIDTFGTGKMPDKQLAEAIEKVFDFQPRSIIDRLALRTPIFRPTAAYGHFGRKPESRGVSEGRTVELFSWEKSDRVDDIRTELSL
ncbi:MAG TPA: methionine adenosyltransferase [Gemmatimonadetes bacterium]|nr:methionine adenosyltransferase [Gemmatimonadota bacterium]